MSSGLLSILDALCDCDPHFYLGEEVSSHFLTGNPQCKVFPFISFCHINCIFEVLKKVLKVTNGYSKYTDTMIDVL